MTNSLSQYFNNGLFSGFFQLDGYSNFICKETFVFYCCGRNPDNCVPKSFFLTNPNAKIRMKRFIDLMNLIHKEHNLGEFEFELNENESAIYIKSKFWKENVINLEMLCCIFKEVICGRAFKNLKCIEEFVNREVPFYYFQSQEMKKALLKIRDLCDILNAKDQKDAFKKVRSFRSNGLVSCLARNLTKEEKEKLIS